MTYAIYALYITNLNQQHVLNLLNISQLFVFTYLWQKVDRTCFEHHA
jgi:hypothetical protein